MKKKAKKVGKKRYPYIIHACSGAPAFPTHTHGLKQIGMPEFLIDPFAFGPKGNGGLINRAYEYFAKPENKDKLQAILNGEVIKLTKEDLYPDGKEDGLVYCFREVPPTFEAVKQAYLIKKPGVDEAGTRFVQIWVDGDDFALTDEYYKGGVKW